MNYLIMPENATLIKEHKPQFRWDMYPRAKEYKFVLSALNNGEYKLKYTVEEISGLEYIPAENLAENETYSWSVIAVLPDCSEVDMGTRYFFGPYNAASHPANKGIDYSFYGPPSEEIIARYLSRGVSCYIFDEIGGLSNFEENLRMILNTGAKYVQRAYCCEAWNLAPERHSLFPRIKSCIEKAHEYDPDIIFEGGVYEIVDGNVEKTKIPPYVFSYFGLPVEDRCFVLDDMTYLDNHNKNIMGQGTHSPDLSRLETQMWFFYRATLFIDMGFEAVHLGSTPSMCDVDAGNGYAGFKRMTDAIHEYAKDHARRGYVLLNAHSKEMKTPENELVLDFYAWLVLGDVPEGETAGAPSEEHPQRLEINIGKNPYSIYGKSAGGIHPCGYEVKNAPYVVEFDNYGVIWSEIDQPHTQKSGMYPWGWEEIAWFIRQPESYRRSFLKYAYKRIKEIDPLCGHITMPLLRCGCYKPVRSNLPEFGYGISATGDEVTIRDIFVEDNC